MRVAALYDVHGNLPALEAVLVDPRLDGVDALVSGGDLVAGPMPVECFDLLASLDLPVAWVRGNGDREAVARNAAYGLDWCAGRLGSERLAGIATWPLAVELGEVQFCHATPRSDEEIVTRLTPDGEVDAAFAEATRDVVVVGHTHMQVDRVLPSGRRVVVAGSVGRPYEDERGAFWALVEGREVTLQRTGYDVEAAAAAIRATGYPRAEEHAAQLLDPPPPAEVAPFFEGLR